MATKAESAGVPKYYWVVAVAALAWGLIACGGYVMGMMMSEAEIAALPPAQADSWRSMPTWLAATYATAVWSCLAGAVGLLLRKAWAVRAYVLSLAAALVQFIYVLSTSRLIAEEGLIGAAALPVTIWIVGAALIWFSRMARARGWIA